MEVIEGPVSGGAFLFSDDGAVRHTPAKTGIQTSLLELVWRKIKTFPWQYGCRC
jgi:hypothetical protein